MPNTCLNNNHLQDQFCVRTLSDFWTMPLITLLKMYPRGQRTALALDLKKKNASSDIFLKYSAKRVLSLWHQMLPLFSTINLVYVLKIDISGRDYSNFPKVLISSKYSRFIVENRDNIWCNLMHLKKSVMGLQVRAFKNCSKWTLA